MHMACLEPIGCFRIDIVNFVQNQLVCVSHTVYLVYAHPILLPALLWMYRCSAIVIEHNKSPTLTMLYIWKYSHLLNLMQMAFFLNYVIFAHI